MQFDLPILKHLKFGKAFVDKANSIINKHANPPSPITIESIDTLISDTTYLDELVDDMVELTKILNKTIMHLEQKGGAYLKALDRKEYDSPKGSIEIGGKWAVRMPKDDESKLALFEYLKEREVFERYATVNSRSLNSFFMAEWEAAKKKDPEAWITFSIPGVPAPVFDEFTKIKSKTVRRRKESNENE